MSLYNLPDSYPIPVSVKTKAGLSVTIPDLESQLQLAIHSTLNSPYNLCYIGQPTDANYYRQNLTDFAKFWMFNYPGIENSHDVPALVNNYFNIFVVIIAATPLDQSLRKDTGTILQNLGERSYPMDFSSDPDVKG